MWVDAEYKKRQSKNSTGNYDNQTEKEQKGVKREAKESQKHRKEDHL
jgi:hypothetical protein